jgi:ADP-heptose:LPS heptosyltransferase
LLELRALGLGDLLTAVPALRALRRAFPAHRVELAAPASLAPLAVLAGAVDAVLDVSDPAPSGWPPLPRADDPPDLAVNLHGRGPQSTRALRALQPARLWAFGAAGGPSWREGEPEVNRWCRLLAAHGVRADPADLDLPAPPVAAPVADAVVVHPGAGHPGRRWPAARFADVARALHQAGHRVVVTGGPGERELAAAIAQSAGLDGSAVLTDLGVLDLAAQVASAALVLCGDTGVGHLATAYRTRSVLLFGPTPPSEWGPPPDRPEHLVLWRGLGHDDVFGDRPDPALLRLGVAEVTRTALRLLAPRSAGPPTWTAVGGHVPRWRDDRPAASPRQV